MAQNAIARGISSHLMSGRSSVPRREALAAPVLLVTIAPMSLLETAGPLFEQIDCCKEDKGKQQQHDRQGNGPGIVVRLQAHYNQVGGDLRFERQIAGDKNDG